MSQEASDKDKDPAAGEDLFQFDGRTAPAAEPSEAEDALVPMGLVDDTAELEPEGPADDAFAGEPARRAPLPPVVVPLLVVMAIANLALVGLTWRSLRREEPLGAPTHHPAAEDHGHAGSLAGDAHADGGERHAEERAGGLGHLAGSRDEAWAALDDAERTLDAGDFVAARRELYGLLTVLDRVELAERPDVEARAGFLIAESYRLQARSLVAVAEEAP